MVLRGAVHKAEKQMDKYRTLRHSMLKQTSKRLMYMVSVNPFLTISDDFVNVKGFRMVRKDRSYSIGGGLVLYNKENIEYKRRVDLEDNLCFTVETIWVELKLTCEPILLCIAYRPPKYNSTFTNQWIQSNSVSYPLILKTNR